MRMLPLVAAITLLVAIPPGRLLPGSAAAADPCVEAALAWDDSVAALRNHAPEDTTLAEAVARYVTALDAMPLEGCPPAFVDAYRRHRRAWERSLVFFSGYPRLRGEMHALFEQIRDMGEEHADALATQEEAIWGSWAEVEAALSSRAPESGEDGGP